MGIEALQKYNGIDPADTNTANDIISKLDKHILGEPNKTLERLTPEFKDKKKPSMIMCLH